MLRSKCLSQQKIFGNRLTVKRPRYKISRNIKNRSSWKYSHFTKNSNKPKRLNSSSTDSLSSKKQHKSSSANPSTKSWTSMLK